MQVRACPHTACKEKVIELLTTGLHDACARDGANFSLYLPKARHLLEEQHAWPGSENVGQLQTVAAADLLL